MHRRNAESVAPIVAASRATACTRMVAIATLAVAAFALGLAPTACTDFGDYHLAESQAAHEGDGGAVPAKAATTVDPVEPAAPPDATGKCTGERKLCGGQCVSRADPAHGCGDDCGACDVPHGSPGCRAGACVVRSCDANRADCNGNASDGCEADTSSDLNNCGGCKRPCEHGQVCSAGACASTCAAGLTTCGGTCVDTKTSDTHCGGCDRKCKANERCVEGSCTCHPNCAGKVCGEADGCGGTCDGSCAAGLRCEKPVCVCDARSCNGCCDATGKCQPGNARPACGAGGAQCTACAEGATCSAGACKAPAGTSICADNRFSGSQFTCEGLCGVIGPAGAASKCITGCFGAGIVGYRTLDGVSCRRYDDASALRDCTALVAIDQFSSLLCCCS